MKKLLSFALLVLLCSQSEAGPNCTSSGPIRLRTNRFRPCDINRFNERRLQVRSPNFPQNYPDNTICSGLLKSDEPRYLEATIVTHELARNDNIFLRSAFNFNRLLGAGDVGSTIVLPTSHSRMRFRSNRRRNDRGFNIRFVLRRSPCHRICYLGENESGSLAIPDSFEANTICENWLRAPPGCTIRVSFDSFDVGSSGSSCTDGYVGFDLMGDPTYRPNTAVNFCGSTIPPDQVSLFNELNVLLNAGSSSGSLDANFTVMCPTPATTTPESTTTSSSTMANNTTSSSDAPTNSSTDSSTMTI